MWLLLCPKVRLGWGEGRLTLHPADSALVGMSGATSSCEVGLIWKISLPLGLAKPVVGVGSCGRWVGIGPADVAEKIFY